MLQVADLLRLSLAKVELFRPSLEYLPPYSPQLNPDELVWKCVKAEVAKQVPKTAGELMEIARQALRSLAKRTQTIIDFFRHPDCQYALQN